MTMEPDEVHAEIERRKKRAKDLKIREVLWSLYNSHFLRYEAWIRENPQLVYPGIKEAFKISAKEVQFSIGRTTYQLTYKEGLVAKGERLRGRDRGEFFEEDIIPATLALRVDDQWVFEFDLCRRIHRTQFGPGWDDPLGEVTRFIDGPWVLELTDLLEKIRAHEEGVRNGREGPRKARELEALKKRFGL
jgi:hypothetical protein